MLYFCFKLDMQHIFKKPVNKMGQSTQESPSSDENERHEKFVATTIIRINMGNKTFVGFHHYQMWNLNKKESYT